MTATGVRAAAAHRAALAHEGLLPSRSGVKFKLGRELGRLGGQCPGCRQGVTSARFMAGTKRVGPRRTSSPSQGGPRGSWSDLDVGPGGIHRARPGV